MRSKRRPVAVLTSDVHYSLSTLELADAAMNQAIALANKLRIPLIDAGDLTNDKALLRAEVVNRLLQTFARAKTPVYLLVGNHSLVNEHGKEHALNFLSSLAVLVDEPMDIPGTGCHGIPYFSDTEVLRQHLNTLPAGATLIMHQGTINSNAGDYFQDKSAIPLEWLKDFRAISGHYHHRQTRGAFDYIGNPYTLTFGEANDPEKGFQVLYDDGSLEFIPTNLRKHVKITLNPEAPAPVKVNPDDPVMVRLKGPEALVKTLTRKDVQNMLTLPMDNFRLVIETTDKPLATSPLAPNLTNQQAVLSLIESSSLPDAQKSRIKELYGKY